MTCHKKLRITTDGKRFRVEASNSTRTKTSAWYYNLKRKGLSYHLVQNFGYKEVDVWLPIRKNGDAGSNGHFGPNMVWQYDAPEITFSSVAKATAWIKRMFGDAAVNSITRLPKEWKPV